MDENYPLHLSCPKCLLTDVVPLKKARRWKCPRCDDSKSKEYMDKEKEWWETEEGKEQLLLIINENFKLLPNGELAPKSEEYKCSHNLEDP